MVLRSTQYPTEDGNSNDLEPWVEKKAKGVVSAFLLDYRITGYAKADLVQEVLVRWLEVRSTYSPTGGASPQTYFEKVAYNHLLHLLERQLAQKRGEGRRDISLEAPLSGDTDDEFTLADVLADPAEWTDPVSTSERQDVTERVRSLLADMSPFELELCQGLSKRSGLSALSRQMGVPRTTLQGEVKRLRRRFTDAGLDDFAP